MLVEHIYNVLSNFLSFVDIPLTPKERSLLTGEGNNEPSGVRASHSSESVLDAPDTPPPKPARPNRYRFKSENLFKSHYNW